MVKEYVVRVNGRVFEHSLTEARRDEIVGILKQVYPGSEITVEERRLKELKVEPLRKRG